MAVNTYYFDGSDEAANVTSGSFNNITNLDDGDTGTYTDSSTDPSIAIVGGTNAPSSGGTITQVRGRHFGGHGGASGVITYFYTDGKGEELGSVADGVNLGIDDPGWSSYTTLSTPTGGWTWAKIQALEAEIRVVVLTGATQSHRIEIEVTSSSTGRSSITSRSSVSSRSVISSRSSISSRTSI